MKHLIKIKSLEKAIIIFFGFSVFTSKAGLNISVVLLFILFFYQLISDKNYWTQMANNKIFLLSISLYIIGLLSTLVYPSNLADTIYFARKAAFLLVIPCLFILNMDAENKSLAINSVCAGFMVAAVNVAYQAYHLGAWHGERVTSFFDLGRWSEMLTYFLVFLLPLLLDAKEKKQKRILYLLLIIIGYACLILSGSRGGMLATVIVTVLYLVIYKRYVLLKLSAILLIVLPLLMFIFPSTVNVVEGRIASIANTTTDGSNSARIKMWESGYLFAVDNLKNNPTTFFFGTGLIDFEREYSIYINSLNDNILSDYPDFSFRDNHNGILDATNKLGIVYELMFLVLIVLITRQIMKASPNIKYSGLSVIVAFFIIGMFYTNQLEYQTICFFYFISISLPSLQEKAHA
ncbi:O-antigen ligase family protein [Psychromonas aquimarina]|uniref:O-antigen ligase family protein n=1 Tax=Psychromonas aquimarina TaxID=444919 RepID=UPI000409CA34|nr:O-antigen ligase family protein [Psychromonas aquimarina]